MFLQTNHRQPVYLDMLLCVCWDCRNTENNLKDRGLKRGKRGRMIIRRKRDHLSLSLIWHFYIIYTLRVFPCIAEFLSLML